MKDGGNKNTGTRSEGWVFFSSQDYAKNNEYSKC